LKPGPSVGGADAVSSELFQPTPAGSSFLVSSLNPAEDPAPIRDLSLVLRRRLARAGSGPISPVNIDPYHGLSARVKEGQDDGSAEAGDGWGRSERMLLISVHLIYRAASRGMLSENVSDRLPIISLGIERRR